MFSSMFTPHVHLPEAASSDDAHWYVVDERQQVLLIDGQIPTGAEAPVASDDRHLMGLSDGIPVWAVRGGREVEVTATGEADHVHLRSLFGKVPDDQFGLAGRASQILMWARDHKFCGRCGKANENHPSDRAMVCPACKAMAFPRISPAVIMLVERDDGRALLAWGAQFPGRFFSALAGFVEPGESLEECVQREVMEEVGIQVDNVTYFGSQPWPFPHSLMIGFRASYVSGELVLQEEEIVEAGWYTPDDLPPVPRGGMSIAGWLIDDWIERTT